MRHLRVTAAVVAIVLTATVWAPCVAFAFAAKTGMTCCPATSDCDGTRLAAACCLAGNPARHSRDLPTTTNASAVSPLAAATVPFCQVSDMAASAWTSRDLRAPAPESPPRFLPLLN
jgi:hypothetical protein